ncbi:response regulator transcription factor [Suttonella sp. R2A3]|uniref:response regulator transcription factor n=1 Tax=Suttonella sp. R2A3 TaxID=2908648 RepID=UPI001F33B407|nr:response regulator transcription factor [Suttonella sp. R2A3]UJF24262.1 response regulator transcription factor [Suttonella sp. R2A3]
MLNILLADDDDELSELLSEYLRNHGLSTETVHDGKAALARVAQGGIDLLVLDIMMPELDGISVLRQLPNVADVPVIMLTAKGDDIDRILGLELGADDYLPKPCHPRELLARIHAVCKRAHNEQSSTTNHPRLSLNRSMRRCLLDGDEITLTGSEFDMLDCLLRRHGEVVSKETLSQEVLQRELLPFDRSVDVHISRLRKKLHPLADDPIKSVRGKGYQLVI